MRYVIRYMLSIMGACAAGMSGGAFGTIPEMSLERMHEVSTHIFLAKVVRIYSSTDNSSPSWEVTRSVAELAIKKVEKGKHEPKLAYVRFETRRPAKNSKPMPGDAGHIGIPKAGGITRVFVVTDTDGGYDVLPPNGFSIVNQK